MHAFIEPPQRIPLILRLGIWISEKVTGRIMLPARILAWYPKAAVGSGALELLVAHHDGKLDERMLKLVRMAASFATACPFCIDMNSHEHESLGIGADEVLALRGSGGAGKRAHLLGTGTAGDPVCAAGLADTAQISSRFH